MQSILTTGAKTFVPRAARGQFFVTPDNEVTRNMVTALTRHGHLVRAKVRSAYRLFALAKDERRARILYDLSPLTPFLDPPACYLPRALDLLQSGRPRWGIKIDLKNGFYHIPVDPRLGQYLGVRLASGQEFRWTVLPMGLATAPAIMQAVMGAVVKTVTERCPGVTGKVYLDDFLFLAEEPHLLLPIPGLMKNLGLQINMSKSRLSPTQNLTYLLHAQIAVKPAIQDKVIAAISRLPSLSMRQSQGQPITGGGRVNVARACSRRGQSRLSPAVSTLVWWAIQLISGG